MNLKENNFVVFNNSLGKIVESFKGFCEGIKKLPNNLKNLRINLSSNYLGHSIDNLRVLGEGIK